MKNSIPIIGIFGSSKANNVDLANISHDIGKEIQEWRLNMLTGACPGLPFEAAKGCYDNRHESKVIGISPFSNEGFHKEKGLITDFHDIIVYTGLGDNLEGSEAYSSRNNVNANTINAGIVLPGTAGTLSELKLSLTKGKEIAVVSGIVEEFDDKVKELVKKYEDRTPSIFYSNAPRDIVKYIKEAVR